MQRLLIILSLGFLTACSLSPVQATLPSQAVTKAATVAAVPPALQKESTATLTPTSADAIDIDPTSLPPSPAAESTGVTAEAVMKVMTVGGKETLVYLNQGTWKQVKGPDGLTITEPVLVPLAEGDPRLTVLKEGKPQFLINPATLEQTHLKSGQWLYEDGIWQEWGGDNWQEVVYQPLDAVVYTADMSQVPEEYQAEFETALSEFTFEPAQKAFSNRLNKTVYVANGAEGKADKIVGVWNFEDSGQVYRAYGWDKMVFITSDPTESRYILRRKSGGSFIEEPNGYLIMVNDVRAMLAANAASRHGLDLPPEAWEESSLYFVKGEGRKYFEEGEYYAITTHQTTQINITKNLWIIAERGDGDRSKLIRVLIEKFYTALFPYTYLDGKSSEMLQLIDGLCVGINKNPHESHCIVSTHRVANKG